MTAPSLHRVPADQLPEDLRDVWNTLNKLTGNAQFVEVFANAPDLLKFVMEDFYANVFFGGALEQRYKQLARLRLSLVHGCRTCNLQNRPGASEAGFTDEQIQALETGAMAPFDDAEQAVLEFTELMTLDNREQIASTDLIGRLKNHFSDAQICELGVVTAFVSGFAKLSFVLDLVDKEAYCRFG